MHFNTRILISNILHVFKRYSFKFFSDNYPIISIHYSCIHFWAIYIYLNLSLLSIIWSRVSVEINFPWSKIRIPRTSKSRIRSRTECKGYVGCKNIRYLTVGVLHFNSRSPDWIPERPTWLLKDRTIYHCSLLTTLNVKFHYRDSQKRYG